MACCSGLTGNVRESEVATASPRPLADAPLHGGHDVRWELKRFDATRSSQSPLSPSGPITSGRAALARASASCSRSPASEALARAVKGSPARACGRAASARSRLSSP
eukprot:CAMPEP_0168500632 /NCGR_PEP_ID=MMETSP0228-20121227/74388_1 /TAXON_ID=133427 /ORGANISM="Protoceratium reticulatum, Strain CCCM 535 (=CCMP 1889)" /LENGTH=106 /DNA_ID=CAMNT_0008517559 /DNA_START=19 /DNA_END=337 /DNA_ORIENTATION=+